MKRVIINADDFGMSEAFNYGVIRAVQAGVVSSTSIMINQPAAKHAISLLKEVPGLYVGLHVNLTTGSPVSNPADVSSLVKSDGSYIGSKDFKTHKKHFLYEDAYKETIVQIEKFRDLFGFYPSHIEPHSAMDDNSAKALLDAARKYKLHADVVYKGKLIQPSENDYLQIEQVIDEKVMEIINRGVNFEDFVSDQYHLLAHHDNSLVTELHFHPGYLDQYIFDHSTLTVPRVHDLKTLCSSQLKKWLEINDIEPISFGDLKK
ncbi:MAG: ChbG/HpnK family deacetylase [Liquorilactobacillus nagelii]|uniref:ChbG/HpnK family deacetylase n=1 Tax=Liquorilactobacillus nagelii TaxID=82688 RepID=UPI002431CD56|nr:ChbG/HpnK family deacetylase [Liquorilactobacillus nagelii]MCI1632735.1 ChbG/HpnK family deacetylase [Liquorilactobacillus nagelii]